MRVPEIFVLAGVNGAGKSSIGGAIVRKSNSDYFNPDEAARAIRGIHPMVGVTEANSIAWNLGRHLLEKAIEERCDFAFETTLGGNTIANLLIRAAESHKIHVWYAGLESVDLHLDRVRARVTGGGHDIPETDIRRRWNRSRENLIRLLPFVAGIRVFDNSRESDPAFGLKALPTLVLHMESHRIVGPADLSNAPQWAKPIVAAAIKSVQAP